jgi:hypothetical protein
VPSTRAIVPERACAKMPAICAAVNAGRPASEASAELLPHRRRYLLLVTAFLRGVLELHLELVDAVERELDPGGDQPKNASASA